MIGLPPAAGPAAVTLTAAMGTTVQLLLVAQGKTYVLHVHVHVAADADAERLTIAASARTLISVACFLLCCG
eukprot:4469977-Prymnesium_polylepis.1